MTREERENLGNALLKLYTDFGFGAVPKREIDLLMFHHITQAHEHQGKSNYELASLLKVPESRVKSFRLASALKYLDIIPKAVLGRIALRLSQGEQFLTVESGRIEISLKDPVERRELENFLKKKGHFAEYTFNAEVVRIHPVRLFELIVENMEHAEDRFNELIRAHINDAEMSERILGGAPTLRQKFTRLRKEAMSANTLVALVGGAASAMAG